MNTQIAIYLGAGLAACGLVGGGFLLGRAGGRQRSTDKRLLDAIIARQSAGSSPRSGSVPQVSKSAGQLTAMEGHLRTAIFDPAVRERLVTDAMRSTGGDRAAAIRKVLADLQAEDKRWS